MTGKSKCKILKDIRRKIAADNDIAYITSECRYQGDCTGTCPKCEEELRYLEQELRNRQKAGKAVAVAGIAAALVVSGAGCGWNKPEQPVADPPAGDVPYYENAVDSPAGDVPYYEEIPEADARTGDAPYYDNPTEEELILMGDVPAETEPLETVEPLMGDVAIVETGESCDE